MNSKRKKLAIIDGKSVFYRGYYAMPNLATADGTPTGGVFGFATMALEVVRRLRPDFVAVAWDKPKTNIRKRLELYPEYKAGRKPAPADFYDQIPLLIELLSAFGWPLYELDDYEADDIMGTLACQATAKGIETMLVTSDLDMLQLVDPLVHVFALKKGLSNIELYSPESFQAKYGIRVDQFLDLKALKGDSSDNIPGVPGIGEKTAIKLLNEHQTLDGIYANVALLPKTIADKLDKGKDLAYLSKQLSAIWTDAPLELNLSEMDGTGADAAKITEIFERLQFRSLIRQLPEVLSTKMADHQHSLSKQAEIATGTLQIINSDQQLEAINLTKAEEVFIASRAAGAQGSQPQTIILSFDGQTSYALDIPSLSQPALKSFLGRLPALSGYNLKATLKLLLQLGVGMPPVAHDCLIAAFVLNSLRRDQTLTDMAQTELNYGGRSLEELDGDEFVSAAPTYMALLKALAEKQRQQLAQNDRFEWLVKNIEWPIIPVLAQMEVTGIQLDRDYLANFAKTVDGILKDTEHKIFEVCGHEFNIGSPSQLAVVLFNELGLPTAGIKKGKSGYSTAASELDKLRSSHVIIDLISQYREVAKLKSTYVDSLPKQVDNNSRLHTTFNLTIAQTGRLSSTDPNLQNIPTRTELGRQIRTAFVAGKGKKLVSADYSQFELRLAAVLAEDSSLIEMFNRGADIHLMTAAEIYGRQPEDVTKQMRSAAKTINFGIIYGMSPHGLSVATGMSREQAVSFIKRYKDLRRPIFDYMDRLLTQAKKDGYVETLFGRRRPMPDIHSANFAVRSAAERAAINMPIQGTEADLMKLAMIRTDQMLAGRFPTSRQLLQVHDSILLECDEKDATEIANALQKIMQEVYELPVRLDVDVVVGDNWGEL